MSPDSKNDSALQLPTRHAHALHVVNHSILCQVYFFVKMQMWADVDFSVSSQSCPLLVQESSFSHPAVQLH